MAKVVAPPAHEARYEEDFYLWTRHQAELLRARRFDELDLAHLIEEVEDLGTNLRNTATSRTREILLHLLKLEYSPAAELRRGWHESVGKQRDDLELELTRSLRQHLANELENIYRKARPTSWLRTAFRRPRCQPAAPTRWTRSSIRTGSRPTVTASRSEDRG
jgi:hypothetical protein